MDKQTLETVAADEAHKAILQATFALIDAEAATYALSKSQTAKEKAQAEAQLLAASKAEAEAYRAYHALVAPR